MATGSKDVDPILGLDDWPDDYGTVLWQFPRQYPRWFVTMPWDSMWCTSKIDFFYPITCMMIFTITMMILICSFTVTPNLRLTSMTGIQFDQSFAKIEETDKEGFNDTLTVEVREKDKNAILEAAKREADKARAPPLKFTKLRQLLGNAKGRGHPRHKMFRWVMFRYNGGGFL